jgi:hypothetical protein
MIDDSALRRPMPAALREIQSQHDGASRTQGQM